MEPVVRWVTFLGGLMAVGLVINLAVVLFRRIRGGSSERDRRA